MYQSGMHIIIILKHVGTHMHLDQPTHTHIKEVMVKWLQFFHIFSYIAVNVTEDTKIM